MSNGYATVPREVINDREISLKALGLYAFITDKPEGWVFSADRIAAMKADGRKAVINALRELEQAGYLTRAKRGDGRISYTLSMTQSAERDIRPECPKGHQDTQSAKKAKCQKGKVPKGTPISKHQYNSKPQYNREASEPDSEKPNEAPSKPTEPLPQNLDTPQFRQAWTDWQTHRRETRKPLTPSTARAQLAKLSAWGQQQAIAAINQSIENGWQGLFPPREGTAATGAPAAKGKTLQQQLEELGIKSDAN